VYERRLEGRTLSFGYAGMLYHESFVMYDRQSDSLWVSATGRAFFGPMQGKRLRMVPSTVTSWANWKRTYPHTRVLSGKRAGSLMGGYVGFGDAHLLGMAVIVQPLGKLYPFTALGQQPLINDRFNGVDLLLVYRQEQSTVTVWNRRLRGRTLTFHTGTDTSHDCGVLLRDGETGSGWCWLTGRAVSGPLRGSKLQRVSAHPIFNERFGAFYPDGPRYSAPSR
jgi:hypothetical protein